MAKKNKVDIEDETLDEEEMKEQDVVDEQEEDETLDEEEMEEQDVVDEQEEDEDEETEDVKDEVTPTPSAVIPDPEEGSPLAALIQVTGLKQNPDETGEDYSQRMYEAVRDIPEETWDKLCDLNEEAARWHNRYHNSILKEKKPSVIPGVDKGLPGEKKKKGGKRGRPTSRASTPRAPRTPREKRQRVIKDSSKIAAWRIRDLVVSDLNMKPAEMSEVLANEGFVLKPATVTTTRTSFMRSLIFLRKRGLLNENKIKNIEVLDIDHDKDVADAAD